MGIWEGTLVREVPSVITRRVTGYGIVRQFLSDFGCGVHQLACYATSETDLGSVNLGGCFFSRSDLGVSEAVGGCAETSTSKGGTIRATANGDRFSATVENIFQGQVIERWRIDLTRRR